MTELDTSEVIMNHKVVAASESDYPLIKLELVRVHDHTNIIEIDYEKALPVAFWVRLHNPYIELSNIQYVLETKSTNEKNIATFAEIGGCDGSRRAAGKTGQEDLGIFYRIEEWPEPQGEFHVWGGWATGHEKVRLTEPLIFRRPRHPEQPQQHEEVHHDEAAEHREAAEHHEDHHVKEEKHYEHSEERHAVDEHNAEADRHAEVHDGEADHHAEHHAEEHHTEADHHAEEHDAEDYHDKVQRHIEQQKAFKQHYEEHATEEHHKEEHHAAEQYHEGHVDEHHHEAAEELEEAEAAEQLEMREELGDDTKKQEEMAHDKNAFDHERLKELGQRLAAFRDGNWHGLPHDLKRKWTPEEFRRMREERNIGQPKREYEARKEPLQIEDGKVHDSNGGNFKRILERFRDRHVKKFDLFAHHTENGDEQPSSEPQSWKERYESERFKGGPLDLQQFAYGAIFFVVSNLAVMQLCLMTGKREKGRRDM